MKTTHNGTEVEYVEAENVWRFTLRDRDRSANSLAEAKEIINTPAPKEKPKFDRVQIWFWKYDHEAPVAAEVTSIGEHSRWSSDNKPELRVSVGKNRSRESQTSCYERNPQNDAAVKQWLELHKQAEAIRADMDKIKAKLKRVNIV